MSAANVGEGSFDLRDYFAAAALTGMLAADGNDPRWSGRDATAEYQRGGGKWMRPDGVAAQAYELADAMISARAAVRNATGG